jgi:hypothetical protein
MQAITRAKGYEGLLMSYQERLEWFCRWADHYGLKIITPKYKHNDEDRSWAD